jgi:bifunctional non-homologous end joining protein LigD
VDAQYPAIARAVRSLGARQAYCDGELCGVGPDGIISFNILQLASDNGNAAALVFFLFDLLYLDGEDLRAGPLLERKQRLAALLANADRSLHYSDHQIGRGRAFHERACKQGLEGIVSKRAYAPGNRGLWCKGQMFAPPGICRGRLDRVALTIGHQRQPQLQLFCTLA